MKTRKHKLGPKNLEPRNINQELGIPRTRKINKELGNRNQEILMRNQEPGNFNKELGTRNQDK